MSGELDSKLIEFNYGMDSGYYNGAGYSYARDPERIEKGSRILIIQECGMDI